MELNFTQSIIQSAAAQLFAQEYEYSNCSYAASRAAMRYLLAWQSFSSDEQSVTFASDLIEQYKRQYGQKG